MLIKKIIYAKKNGNIIEKYQQIPTCFFAPRARKTQTRKKENDDVNHAVVAGTFGGVDGQMTAALD